MWKLTKKIRSLNGGRDTHTHTTWSSCKFVFFPEAYFPSLRKKILSLDECKCGLSEKKCIAVFPIFIILPMLTDKMFINKVLFNLWLHVNRHKDYSYVLNWVCLEKKSRIRSLDVAHRFFTTLCLSTSVSIWHNLAALCRCRIFLSSHSLPRNLWCQTQSSDLCHPGTEAVLLNHPHMNPCVPSHIQRRTYCLWCGSPCTHFCRRGWLLSAPWN